MKQTETSFRGWREIAPILSMIRRIIFLMRADFLERVRGYPFLAMLLFSVFLTYIFLPAPGDIFYANLAMGPARPAYSSAAVGSLTTLLMGEFFTLFSFYLVMGSIERDRRTGVGQVIATTPIRRGVYLLGKWLSNTAVLAALVAGMILAAGVLQLVRGEDLRIDLWALAAPFLIILFPALAVIAALAVLFESINGLRGGLGNVLFFGVLILILGLPVDFEGINILYPSLYQACAAQFTGCMPFRQIDLSGALAGLPTFPYLGIAWTGQIIARRLLFVAAGALIALLAALPFHRFDPARADSSLFSRFFQRARDAVTRFVTTEENPGSTEAEVSAEDHPADGSEPVITSFAPLAKQAVGRRQVVLQALKAEFRLAFQGVRWWWFTGAAGVVAAGLLVPQTYVLLIVLPLAWIWPLLIWSGIGARENRYAVDALILSTPHPISRQLTAAWLVGVLIALGMAVGVLVRLALLGQWQVLPVVLVGALFVPTLALAAGCWTGSGKLFEAGYLFIWYLASVHGVPVLDFMGRIPQARSAGLPWFYAGLTLILGAAAVAGRLRSLSR